jgi:hypothetical protein
LYRHAEDEVYNRLRIEASFHGIDLDKSLDRAPTSKAEAQKQKIPMFGDPEDYKGMSANEKEELTQQMMKQLKGWAKGSIMGN